MHHIVVPKVIERISTDRLLLLDRSSALGASLLLALALLQERLGNEDLVMGRDGSASIQIST